MRKKLAGWKSKLLSLVERIILAKVVLATIPIYAMQSIVIAKEVCHEMEKFIRNFIWRTTDENRGVHLVKWDNFYKQLKSCGLGFKKFDSFNNVFLMKIGFNLIKKPDQLWVHILELSINGSVNYLLIYIWVMLFNYGMVFAAFRVR